MPAYVASRRPRSKTARGEVRKVGCMRQQLKPKTAKQLEAEERRLKRFDSDSDDSEPQPLPPKIEERKKVAVAAKKPEPAVLSEDEEKETLEEAELEKEGPEVVEDEEEEHSAEDDDEEEVTEEEDEEDSADEEEDEDKVDSDDEKVSEKKMSKGGKEEKLEDKEEISGWADSIAKILCSTKPKNKKEIMLSRARKDYEVSKFGKDGGKPSNGQDNLEIIPGTKQKLEEGSNEKQETKPNVDDGVLSLKVQRKLELKQLKLERAWENLARLNMEKTEPEVERDLLKIATKGVVQLFNAIALQQKTMKSKLRDSRQSEFLKDKILNQTKEIFDSSMSKSKQMGDGSNLNESDVKVKQERRDDIFSKGKKRKSSESGAKDSKKKPAWNALQDDFMLDAKLKDWDQDSDSE